MPDAVSGGSGLFLMTEQFMTNIGRAPRRVELILRPCGASYGSPSGSTTGNHNIEPLHKVRW